MMQRPRSRPLHRYCKEKCGVVLGVGIGELHGQAFRIAHMGHVNAPMILGTLGVIEVGAERARHSARQGRNRSRDRMARRKCKRLTLSGAVILGLTGIPSSDADPQRGYREAWIGVG